MGTLIRNWGHGWSAGVRQWSKRKSACKCHQTDGRRIATVAIVIHQPRQHVGCPLAQITIVPITDRQRSDRAVRGDLPVTAEKKVRHTVDGILECRPGIPLERFGSNADAKVQLAIESRVPRGNHTVLIEHSRVGIVAITRLRGAGEGSLRHGHEKHDCNSQVRPLPTKNVNTMLQNSVHVIPSLLRAMCQSHRSPCVECQRSNVPLQEHRGTEFTA